MSVPSSAPSSLFQGVEWSTCNTLQSQINAAKSCGLDVEVGDTFFDIDTVEDLHKIKRLRLKENESHMSRTLGVILNKFPREEGT